MAAIAITAPTHAGLQGPIHTASSFHVIQIHLSYITVSHIHSLNSPVVHNTSVYNVFNGALLLQYQAVKAKQSCTSNKVGCQYKLEQL